MNKSIYVTIGSVDTCYKCTQKCFMPLRLLKSSHIKVGDYISIECASKKLICRVFLQTQPNACIAADDTVSYQNDQNKILKNDMTALFPENFQLLETPTLRELSIRIVFKNTAIEIEEYIIRKIFCNLVIGNGVTVNCEGQQMAKIFDIDNIEVLSTFEFNFGKVTNATQIHISEMATVEQTIQREGFKNINLGGLQDIYEILKLTVLEVTSRNISKSIIITGPSGCGKSSIVKSFLSQSNAYNIVIDGIVNLNFNLEYCANYVEQFKSICQLWPEKQCILFIDHIDIFTSNHENGDKIYEITYLLNSIYNANLNVLTIATTTSKKILHSAIQNLFDEEITIAMPTLSKRKDILEAILKSFKVRDIDSDRIAHMTPGYVGADIEALCREAVKIKSISEGYDIYKDPSIGSLTTADFEKALVSIEPTALKRSKWNLKVKPIQWDDIGGLKDIKKRLQMSIEWPLHHPEAYQKVGLPCPRGLLLFGPPGCCKTTLARGLATECNANFFAASPAQIYSPYVGESEKNIVELFQQARLCAPSIIFLDELDSLVGQRKFDTKSQGISEKVLSTLLNEMDGFSTKSNSIKCEKILENEFCPTTEQAFDEHYSNNKVIVVAATNRPDLIDDALLRPGRFDVILYAPPPNLEERNSILETLTKGVPIKDINIKLLAEKTEYFSGADLKNLFDMASINALRENTTAEFLTEENFLSALLEVQPSISKDQISMYEQLASKYGPVITTIK